MNKAATIGVSLVVGVAIGYGVAQLFTARVVDVEVKPGQLNPTDVYVSRSHLDRIRWTATSTGLAVNIKPNTPTGPVPYTPGCSSSGTTSNCPSGPMNPLVAAGESYEYTATLGGQTMNGRIIIQK